jgi:hypothetical protein
MIPRYCSRLRIAVLGALTYEDIWDFGSGFGEGGICLESTVFVGLRSRGSDLNNLRYHRFQRVRYVVLETICRYHAEMNVAEPNDQVSLTLAQFMKERNTLRLSRSLSLLLEMVKRFGENKRSGMMYLFRTFVNRPRQTTAENKSDPRPTKRRELNYDSRTTENIDGLMVISGQSQKTECTTQIV